MRGKEIKNAVIRRTMLGIEDHGIMTFSLDLNYGGSGQGFGGWCLDTYDEKLKKRVGTEEGMNIIMAILNLLEVYEWEKLPGHYVRVDADWDKVHGIGHPLEDKWVYIEDFFKKAKK